MLRDAIVADRPRANGRIPTTATRRAYHEVLARVHRVAPGGLSGWPAAALAASAPLSV